MTRTYKGRRVFAITLVLFATLLGVSVFAAAATPKYGGEFNYAWDRDIATFDPASANSNQKSQVAVMMFDRLLTFDSTGGLAPGLAHSWEISDDGLIATFYLREDVKFHSGRAMTAEDVKYSFERLSNPKTAAIGFSELDSVLGKKEYAEGLADEIVGIRVVDDHTIEVELVEPDAVFLRRVATAYASIVGHEGVNEDFEMVRPVGTGAFQYIEYVPNQHIKMEKSPYYWEEGKPYLDRVNVYMNVDPSVQLMRYQTGQLDVLWITDPAMKATLEHDPRFKDDIVYSPGSSVQILTLNTSVGPFVNKDLRYAVNWAINRERIARNVINGLGGAAYNPQTESIAENLELEDYFGYDLDKAKEYMAKAGYPDGGLTVELVTVPTTDRRMASEAVQADLAELGINVEVRAVESATYTAMMNSSEVPFGMVNAGSAMGDPDWIFTRFLHSDAVPGFNRAGYQNPEFDALVDAARATFDEEERKALYQQATDIVMEDAAWAPLYYAHLIFAVKPYVEGLQMMPTRPEIDIVNVWYDK